MKKLKKKPTDLKLSKYDINQKIIDELADAESRTILFSIVSKARTAEDLSRLCKIPISTVYSKLNDLVNLSLVSIDKYWFTEHGKKIKFFKSRISKARISIQNSKPVLYLNPN